MHLIWDVEVTGGARDVDVASSAPLKFGTTTVTIGPDGLSDPTVPLVYGPVALRTVGGDWMVMETPSTKTEEQAQRELAERGISRQGPDQHRVMEVVHQVAFQEYGEIVVSGLEAGPDGVPHFVTWVITPTSSPR